MKLQQEVGKKIKAAREEKKVSQQAISDKTGYVRDKISRIEHGKQNLTISTLEKIAEALDKKVNIELR